MSQLFPSDSATNPFAELRHLEGQVRDLRALAFQLEQLAADELSQGWRPAGRRHQPVKLYVIAGGLAALLLGALPALPAGNPVREAVDYTVTALLDQMPSELPDPPDLNLPGGAPTVVIGNPDGQRQPLRPLASVRQALTPVQPSTAAEQAPDLSIRSMRPSGDGGGQVLASTPQPDSSSQASASSPTPSSRPKRYAQPDESVSPAPTASVSARVQSSTVAGLVSPTPASTPTPPVKPHTPKPSASPQPTPSSAVTMPPQPTLNTNKGKGQGKPSKAKGKAQASPQPSASPGG